MVVDYCFLRHCWNHLANGSFGILTSIFLSEASSVDFFTDSLRSLGRRVTLAPSGASDQGPPPCSVVGSASQPWKPRIQLSSTDREQTFLSQLSKQELPERAPLSPSLPEPATSAPAASTLLICPVSLLELRRVNDWAGLSKYTAF